MTLPCLEKRVCKLCGDEKLICIDFYSYNKASCRKCLCKKKYKDRLAMTGYRFGKGWKDTMSTFTMGIYGKKDM